MSPFNTPRPRVLPGIGAVLRLADNEGSAVDVVRLVRGDVEIHHDGPSPVVLDATTAQLLGSFAAGEYTLPPAVAERLADVPGGLAFDLVRLPADAGAVGRSIEQLQIRRRTGVSIVAVLRGPVTIVSPEPGTVLRGGDELVIACREGDRDPFVDYLREVR